MAKPRAECSGCSRVLTIIGRGLCSTCFRNPDILALHPPKEAEDRVYRRPRKARPERKLDDSAASHAARWNRAAKIEAILLSCGRGVTYLQARRWMTEDGDDLTEVEFVEALAKLADRIGVDGQFAPGGARKSMSTVEARGLMLSPIWGPAMNKE